MALLYSPEHKLSYIFVKFNIEEIFFIQLHVKMGVGVAGGRGKLGQLGVA